MTNNNDEERTLNLPQDINLPFFAYGIFKPGQLAYSKIINLVDETVNNVEINYDMRTRDGVPILIDRKTVQSHSIGSIITFKEDCEEKAYAYISKTLLQKLYGWKTIEIGGKRVNILFGVNPDNGSYYMESSRGNFDGKRDPLFSDAIELIEKNLNSRDSSGGMERFFNLQMNYMLLWSAIDRYSSLKYNKRLSKWNNEQFSKEWVFIKGIKKFKDEYHQPVYSTDDLQMHKFNVNKPYETLKYYYTIRCNVVHRGKAMVSDYGLLRQATKELLEIFKDVLNDTFGKYL